MEILSFRLSDRLFGVELEEVNEIVESVQVTGVPLSSDFVEGVMNLRGEPITVIDLKKKIGFEDRAVSGDILLISIKGSTIGLRPDEVLNIHQISGEKLKDVSPGLDIEIKSRYIKGIAKINGEEFIVIDVNKLI